MRQRTKPRVTITLDPDLLAVVDQYVAEHQSEGIDRSGVVSEALRRWYSERLQEALRAQYLAHQSEQELAEAEAWTRIRDAAVEDFVRRGGDLEKG